MELQVHLHAADIDGIAAPLQCLTRPGNCLFSGCKIQAPAVHVERPRPRLQRFGPRYAPTTFRSRYRIKEPWGRSVLLFSRAQSRTAQCTLLLLRNRSYSVSCDTA